jgi:phospholipid/cholesterol/gamma-HCH transport system substrate-binding protein
VLVLGVVVIVVAILASLAAIFLPGSQQTSITAYFTRATSIYPGSQVRILGVRVGAVSAVTPEGSDVRVKLHWDAKYKVPASAEAVIVVPSLVADRYVQLTPAYEKGPALRTGDVLPTSRTVVPLELDDANAAISQLAQVLGPNGANSKGALSRLLSVSAKTFGGEGPSLNQTIQDLSSVSDVLAQNSGNTTQTITNLAQITQALAASNSQVTSFENELSTVSGELSNERSSLATAISTLDTALGQVTTFISNNKTEITSDVNGLTQITGILVHEKSSLEEFLDEAPLAADNALQVYDYQDGSLHSRLDLEQSQNIAMWLCSLAYSLGGSPKYCTTLLQPLNALGLPLSKLNLDLSALTEATTTFDVVPPPPDAYGGNSGTSGTNGSNLGGLING